MTNWSSSLSPLHIAAYNADFKALKKLLRSGVNPDPRDCDDCTPLFWSCFRGLVGNQWPVVAALLDAGADPDLVPQRGGHTALTAAIVSGNTNVVRLLLDRGASPNVLTPQGVSPLMIAASEGNSDMIRAILEHGGQRDFRCEGFSAADYGRYYGHDEVARLIDEWEIG